MTYCLHLCRCLCLHVFALFLFFPRSLLSSLFFFNAPAPTEIYTLSLHDALPISTCVSWSTPTWMLPFTDTRAFSRSRSEEHTSELQSHHDLVCRLLLEKKKTNIYTILQ